MSERQSYVAAGAIPRPQTVLRALGASVLLLLLTVGWGAGPVLAAAASVDDSTGITSAPRQHQESPPPDRDAAPATTATSERSTPGPRFRAAPSYAVLTEDLDPGAEATGVDPGTDTGTATVPAVEESVEPSTGEEPAVTEEAVPTEPTVEQPTVEEPLVTEETAPVEPVVETPAVEESVEGAVVEEPGVTEGTAPTGPAIEDEPVVTEETVAPIDSTVAEATVEESSMVVETAGEEPTMFSTMSFGVLSTGSGTESVDSITIVPDGSGGYEIFVNGASVGTVSGTDTFDVDGLGGEDILTAPDLASIWKITGVDTGTLELPGGAKIAFSNVESLTGAATASDEFRFDENAGVTGAVDDGAGQLTVTLSGFVKVVGNYTFERQTGYAADLSDGTGATLNVIKLGGTGGTGFVGVDVLGAEIGMSGTLGSFALAVLSGTDQAWHTFSGLLSSPSLVGGSLVDLDMHLDQVSISMNNATKAPGSTSERFVDLSGTGKAITPTGSSVALGFDKALTSATVPVLLDLGGFLFVQGDLTMTDAGELKVDVETGLGDLDLADIPADLKDSTKVTQGATSDPTDGTLATNADFSKLWNLPVTSLEFAFTGANAFVGYGFGWDPTTDSDGVLDQSEVGADAIGIFAGGINLAFVLLTPFGAAPISQKFLGLRGSVAGLGLVGLDDVFELDVDLLEFEVNKGGSLVSGAPVAVVDWAASLPEVPNDSATPEDESKPAGYRVFLSGVSPPSIVIDSTAPVFKVSATRAVISIASFIHIGGSFSLESGETMTVDVEVENPGTDAAAIVTEVANTDSSGDQLATNGDGSMIYNLPVETMLIGIAGGSVFVGYNPGGFDVADPLPSTPADLHEDAVGLLAAGVSVGLVLATPVAGSVESLKKLPSFLALRADFELLVPVGLPAELTLYAKTVRVLVNRGGKVGTDATSLASVDWLASFPDPDGPDDPETTGVQNPEPAGLVIPAGGGSTVLVDMADPITAVKADLVVLSIDRFVHISGGFSFELGGSEVLDVKTAGLTPTQQSDLVTAVGNQDAADDALATDATGQWVYNLPVTTTLIGISNAGFFVGYNPNVVTDPLTGTTTFDISAGDPEAFDAADLTGATGLSATGIDAAFVLAAVTGNPITGYRFGSIFAMKALIADLGPEGLPSEFVLDFTGVQLSVNRAASITKVGLGTTARVIADWTASFPDPTAESDDPPAGLAVPTGVTSDPVYIDFRDAIIGVSATRVVLAISDFIYISGGFAFENGGTEFVDIDTAGLGLGTTGTAGGTLAGQVNGTEAASAADPGEGITRATANASTIWNVPVVLTKFGIANGSLFVGYNPNLQGTSGTSFDTDGDWEGDDPVLLEEQDLHEDSIGLLANGIQVGLVFASVDAVPGVTWMTQIPSFWALDANIAHMLPVGLPDEFVLTFQGINLSVNHGGAITGTTAVQNEAWINWQASFPDPEGSDPAGLEVPTGNTNPPVFVDIDDPIFAISATRVVLAISDFVYISGGFAFEKGGREEVDIDTGSLSSLNGAALELGVNGAGVTAPTADPGAGVIRASDNAGTIWNVPVITTTFGVSNASVFVGYNPNLQGTGGTSFTPDGTWEGDDPLLLEEQDLSGDSIGLLANGITVGLVFASVEPIPDKTWDDNLPAFWAIKATIANLLPVGLPDGFRLSFEGVALSINRGGQITGYVGSEAWVNWQDSFPSSDEALDGLPVATGSDNPKAYVDIDDPIFGISATRVVIAISDFVYISGGFAFEIGGREDVDIDTSGLGASFGTLVSQVQAAGGEVSSSDTDGLGITSSGSTIWNVPVVTTLIGVSNASIFIGYNPNDPEGTDLSFDPGEDGILDETELSDEAIGLLASGIDVGVILAKAETAPGSATDWRNALPKFVALRAEIAALMPIGLPEDLVFKFYDAGVSVNSGGPITGHSSLSGPSNAWIDWESSFPAASDDPAGYAVPTGMGNDPVIIDFDSPIIRVEAERIVISIFEFVHISGGFTFQKGAIYPVTIDTGLNTLNPLDVPACLQLKTAVTASGVAGGSEGINTTTCVDTSGVDVTLTNVSVQTIEIGVHNASIFVGYNPEPPCDWAGDGDSTTDGPEDCATFDVDADEDGVDGALDASELSEGAVGFLAGGIDLGLVIADFLPGAFTEALQAAGAGKLPSFFAIKARANELMLVGVDSIEVTALDATIEVNLGGKWTNASNALSPPVIDWMASFPAVEDTEGTPADESTPAGLAVATGGSNPPVYIDYDGYLIGGGVSRFTLRISDFIYITGSVYFEYGATETMPLTDGIVDTSLLGSLISALPEAIQEPLQTYSGICVPPEGSTECTEPAEKTLQFMTIGAQDVQAFVGMNFWTDTNGNGIVDLDPDGTIKDDELNPDRVGLELTDLDFALAMMTPVLRLDPVRYLALHASAGSIELVGIDGLTAYARDVLVELNLSSPTFQGLPVLPVIDWKAYAERDCIEGDPCTQKPYGVKVAAADSLGGDPVTFDFLFDTPLIRAWAGEIKLNVFDVLVVRGSIAFELGRTISANVVGDATSTPPLTGITTMTIGGANLMGFVGANGPSWLEDSDGDVVWQDGCVPGPGVDCEAADNPDAVGLAINDLDFGILVGLKASLTEPAVFIAAAVNVDDFGFVGLPDGFSISGTLALAINIGLAVGVGAYSNRFGGIDFSRGFHYDPNGPQGEAPEGGCTATYDDDPDCDDLAGFAVPTGDATNPIVLTYDETFVSLYVAGVVTLGDYAQALGLFYLSAGSDGLKVLATAQLLIGPDKVTDPSAGAGTPILEIQALGVLILNGQGVAADLDVDFGLDVTGLTLTASVRLLINTTGVTQEVAIPAGLLDFLQEQRAAGSTLAGNLLDRLDPCADPADGECYGVGGTAPNLLDSTTVYNLLHNPGGPIQTSGSPGAYVVVLIEGTFNFIDLAEGEGLAGIRISGDVFQLIFDLDFEIGIQGAGLNFSTSGQIQIAPEGFTLDVSLSINADVTSLFHFDVNGTLSISTVAGDEHFTLDLSGRLDIVSIFSVSGSLYVNVQNGGWVVSVSASGDFGPFSISGSGTIRSDGTFDLTFSAGFQIGPDVVHIGGSVTVRIYMENAKADGTVCNADTEDNCGVREGGTLRFGFSLHGGVEACAFGICLGVDLGISLHGQLSGNPSIPSYLTVTVEACVDLLFDDACASYDVATIRLPGTIFPEPPPLLADQVGSTLVLNVGTRGIERNEQPTRTDEAYQLKQLAYDSVGGTWTIQVIAFGRAEIFSGIASVSGDFGGNHDSLVLLNGSFPVTASGGEGNDNFSSLGSGPVNFSGGAGNDTLVGSSGADSLDGGVGDDYLDGRAGTDVLIGGPGSISVGQTDNDIFFMTIVDAFGENPQAGAGVDTIEIQGTTGADAFTVSTSPGVLQVAYSGGSLSGTLSLVAFEHVVLHVGNGADTITASGNFLEAGILDVVLALTEATAANDLDGVVVNLTGSADLLRLTGGTAAKVNSLVRSGYGTITYPPASGDGTVATTTVTWNGTSVLSLNGSGLADADRLTVNTLGGADNLLVVGSSANTILDAGSGDDRIAVGSMATATTNTGGTVSAVDALLDVRGGDGTDSLTVDDSGDTTADTGALTSSTLSGLDLSTAGLSYAAIELLDIALGLQGDAFTITSTAGGTQTRLYGNGGADVIVIDTNAGPTWVYGGSGADVITLKATSATLSIYGDGGADLVYVRGLAAPTFVYGGAADDAVLVGSTAPATAGVLEGIAAYLSVDGGDGDDSLALDDTGDAAGDIGYLTDGRIAGLGMTIDSGHAAAAPAWVVVLGGATGGDFVVNLVGVGSTAALSFDVTARQVEDAINALYGVRAVTVSRSPQGRAAGMSYLIRWTGLFTGAPPSGTTVSSSLTGSSVTVSVTPMSSGYVDHLGFETLGIDLGSGDDFFDVDSTIAGDTAVSTGAGHDVVTVETISGVTSISGEAGDDSITVNALPDLPSTANGLGALLALVGGSGSDTYVVQTFGNGDSRIDVLDDEASGTNTLIVDGTSAADVFLLRSTLVASLNTPVDPVGVEQAFAHAELVTYDGDITGGLTVNGYGGGDLFALDDNSTETTINGGIGDDFFQIGQMLGEELDRLFVPEFAPVLTNTTRGQLTNGVSFATTINGGEDDDFFNVYRNVAPLALNGNSGDDTFVVRTFIDEDATSAIGTGDGSDTVQYVLNAPVAIDGGDGFDRLVVIGTEADDTFVVTADGVFGAGRTVSYVNLEQVDLETVEGNDTVIVLSTSAGVSTRIFGGLGSDLVIVGKAVAEHVGSAAVVNLVQGPLFVSGGDNPDGDLSVPPAPVMLPTEWSGSLYTTPNPNFDMIEEDQVDRLVVDDSDTTADTAGVLTGSRITGLGMGGDLVLGDTTVPGGITYAAFEGLEIHLGSGDDSLTVDSTHQGRTFITGGAGADTLDIETIAGHTRVSTDEGDDTFLVGTGVVDDIDGLLVLDGGAGTDAAFIDDSAETDDQLATLTPETLTGLDMVARTGMDRMYSVTVWITTGTFTIALDGVSTAPIAWDAGASAVQAALQALLFPDATSCGLDGGSTPGRDSRCAQSVFVWQHGSTYLIGFTGEVAGADGPVLASSQTDILRLDGISYFGLETLDLAMGSGDDGVNVRGTSASTTIDTGAGDDLVFVSDSANLGNDATTLDAVDLAGLATWLAAEADRDVEALFAALLHGTLAIDDQTFTGSLDLLRGDLSLDTGAGSNTLAVSDRYDADGDTGFVLTSGSMQGLSVADIAFAATGGDLAGQGAWTTGHDSGLFGHGISVFLSAGNDTGTISSIRGGALGTSAFGATLSTVYAGAGNDAVTITAPAAGGALLAVHGELGDDRIAADTAATQPLVLFGDEGADTLVGGAGDDLVFGDDGRVYHLAPVAVGDAFSVVLGGAPVASNLLDPRSGTLVTGDLAFLTVDVLRTNDTGIGTGDVIAGQGGNDLLLGGNGNDAISGDQGNDLAFGDFGWVGGNAAAPTGTGWVDTSRLPLSMSLSTHPFAFVSVDTRDSDGGDDTIDGDEGADILLGQHGADVIRGGDGDDDLIGGHNVSGGTDSGDFLGGDAGNDVVLADNGSVLRTGSSVTTLVRVLVGGRLYLLDAATGTFYSGSSVTGTAQENPTNAEMRAIAVLDHVDATHVSYDAATFGDDSVEAGDGDDLVFGQLGGDSLDGGNGHDYIEGNGGSDLIVGGLGQDDLIGGSSDLFGLAAAHMRPDGSDTIFGGDGTAAGRDDAGDGSSSADADVLVGDNGRVIKVRGALGFLAFNYVAGVIPRVIVHLDYSPTGEDSHWLVGSDRAAPVLVDGDATNLGAGDFLHGEAGDDVIHGMSGNDAIFGDAGDDDLYGQAGYDWVSGGAGTDGVLGDDGLILTSRNGLIEPLNHLDVATTGAETIRGTGPHHVAVINRNGYLTKAVDLEPFYVGHSDVIYGGTGADFLHGGEGDDAISGAEAPAGYFVADPLALLAEFYTVGDVLDFGSLDPEEFFHYDEIDPRSLVTVCSPTDPTRCLPFLLTNTAGERDGDDVLFGDGGNDWLFGGYDSDHLYGGWGHDLLDADDDKYTNGGANTDADAAATGVSIADIAFGGAGRDVLMGNTGGDRLIDWVGEYDSYIVPFSPFGAAGVWRAASPATVEWLYLLSAADGADLTRMTVAGDPRHGEPYGELGLLTSADDEWQAQTGAPGDPQAGNDSGSRDVMEDPSLGTLSTEGTTIVADGDTTAATISTEGDSSVSEPAAYTTAGTVSLEQQNKVWSELTITLDETALVDLLISILIVDGGGQTLISTQVSVAAGDTVADLALKLGTLSGMQFVFEWLPSGDPGSSDLTLVIRQVA